MIVSLIVAKANNNGIGKNNDLLWHLPADMKFFKETTRGHCIVTGRKNYESIPPRFRPLANRTNIVITRNKNYFAEGATVCHNIEDAIEFARSKGESKVFIIGGGEIYRQALEKDLVQEMLITEVDIELDADTFFPEFDSEQWTKTPVQTLDKNEKNPYQAQIVRYTK